MTAFAQFTIASLSHVVPKSFDSFENSFSQELFFHIEVEDVDCELPTVERAVLTLDPAVTDWGTESLL